MNPKLQNRRSYVLQRCSTPGQVGNSLNNQTKSLENLIAENQIIVVGQEDLAGVTGSIPGARDDIDKIIRLKRGGLDFDLLLLANTDRFTRAGAFHANSMLYDLEGEGVSVYFAAEGLFSDDRMHRTILSFLFDAAQQTAIAISRGATMGCTNSYLEGRSPYAHRPPYGLDRMYSVNGKDMHLLRNLSDGTQQMLDPKTLEVIRTFGVNPRKGTPAHYIKQKNEQVRLVPGEAVRVAAIHLMFQKYYGERASIHSIAKHLNDTGILSPQGTFWDWTVVKETLTRPIYVGIPILGRTAGGIYYKVAKGAPAEAGIKAKELRERKRPALRNRPYEEWLIGQDPVLAEFLPEPIRQIARAAIEKRLAEEASAKPKVAASKDKHRGSEFFLKNILRSKQGNHPMTGKRSGRHGEKRYYRITRAQNAPRSNSILGRTIPAGPLEAAMLGVLREVLLAKTDMTDAIRKAFDDHVAQRPQADDRQGMEKELRRKQKQLAAAIDSLTGDEDMDQPIQTKLSAYREEMARLQVKLRSVPQPKAPIDLDAAVERLAEQFNTFGAQLDEKDKSIIHEMMKLLVHRLEADLLTREVEVELALPASLAATLGGAPMMGLDQHFACRTPNEAHQPTAIVLAQFLCAAEGRRPVCYTCRRMKKAA